MLTARNLPMAEQIEPFVCNSQCLSNQSLSLAVTLMSDLFSPTSSEYPVLNLLIGPAPPSRTTHTEAVSDRVASQWGYCRLQFWRWRLSSLHALILSNNNISSDSLRPR